MYYVYQNSFFGTELLTKTDDKAKAEAIAKKEMEKWRPGDMWSVKVVDKEQKEVSYFD